MAFFKKILCFGSLLFLANCMAHPTSENFSAKMDSLMGQSAEAITSAWGIPNSTIEHQDGSKTHTWYRQQTQQWNSLASYPGTGSTMFNYWPSAQSRISSWSNRNYAIMGNTGNFHVNRPMRLVHHCTLVVNTDPQGNIKKYDAVGDDCVSY